METGWSFANCYWIYQPHDRVLQYASIFSNFKYLVYDDSDIKTVSNFF